MNYEWLPSISVFCSNISADVDAVIDVAVLEITLNVIKNDEIKDVVLFFIEGGDEIRISLKRENTGSFDKWICCCKLHRSIKAYRTFSYRFKIVLDKDSFFFDAMGAHKYSVSNNKNFIYSFNGYPGWVESAVIYHIFIDRFKSVISKDSISLSWGDVPSGDVYEMYGGDLYGVVEKLNYLQDLGVNTLCFTPIFSSSTNHRYDVEDYLSIDHRLGGNEAFILLLQECKRRDFKIILDGVFNHMSARSPWFDINGDYASAGAGRFLESKYREYFRFYKDSMEYDSFWGDIYLPRLNYESDKLRGVIYKNDTSVVKYWLNSPYLIDGWRLDACCMLGKYPNVDVSDAVLRELYDEAKKVNKECYLFGENPFDPAEIKQFCHLDGMTNYSGFYTPLVHWLDNDINFDVLDFDSTLREFRALMGYQFVLSSKNFIGNHDKKRLFGLLNRDVVKYKNALVFLFTYPGIPTVYYGDEIGLSHSASGEDGRLCMKWDNLTDFNRDVFLYTKKLIFLYKNSISLQKGEFKTLYASEEVFVFERFYEGQISIIILNNSGKVCKNIQVQSFSILFFESVCFSSVLDDSINVDVSNGAYINVSNINSCFPVILQSN